jgi:diguanylate cyclase (GGDEF) domain
VFGNNRKTIGVFISQIFEEYPNTLSHGIMKRANALNYNVAFFTNFGGFGQLAYDTGELHIVNLPNYEDFDGIIVTPDIMKLPHAMDKYIEYISEKCHCPVVSIRKETKGCYNILIDDDHVLDDIIEHFILDHGFTRINFLSGPKTNLAAVKRLESYKRVLQKHNIPVEDERICFGDFWKTTGGESVDYWLNSDKEWPQVIVCANDHMAISVCKALEERGISVPEQIAVSGCDNIEDSSEYNPSITTVNIPTYHMGVEAVDIINKHNNGLVQPRDSYVKTEPLYRASCGCNKNWYYECNTRRCNHIHVRDTLQEEIANNVYMSTDLTGVTKLEEIIEKLWVYIKGNENYTNFCFCLQKEWNQYNSMEVDELALDCKETIMEMGIKGDIRYTKLKCAKNELIPKEFAEDKPVNYFFAVLHHEVHCFGYVAISFNKRQTYMRTFQAWLNNVSNALENVRVHSELNRLIYKLEDMSVRDDLTGLYNRRVLESLGKKYLHQCMEQRSNLMMFVADMDRLKYINDKFGHFYGDISLKVIAVALQKAADDDEICIRLGGDEFMVIGMDYDEMKMDKFLHRFVDELNRFNTIQQHDVRVYVSYGYYLITPDQNTTIENCMRIADSLMYQQKYEKSSKRIEATLISSK